MLRQCTHVLSLHFTKWDFLSVTQAYIFFQCKPLFFLLSPEAMVLMLCSFYFIFKITFYDVLYFCIVCSVLQFLLVCYINVAAAHVEN